jgi:hypothetical protein
LIGIRCYDNRPGPKGEPASLRPPNLRNLTTPSPVSCLFQRAVKRLELIDVSCTVAQNATWKQVHKTIDTYCIPSCTKCQPADVCKWFQELLLLYHSENQVLVTCSVSPSDRISMANLQDKLGHLATLRTALDSAEHTRERLMDMLASHHLLGALSPTKAGNRSSHSTAGGSPEYSHPSKKTKASLQPL